MRHILALLACLFCLEAVSASAEGTLHLGDSDVRADATVLLLNELSHDGVKEAVAVLRQLPQLRMVELGEERENGPTWADIRALEDAAPQAEFYYSFTLYKKPFTLQDREMDLNHIRIEDEGALVREVVACMPKLEWLCMDSCKVSNKAMAEIRDEFPAVEVVWRVWFGSAYSVRTDVEKILASNPGVGGNLTSDELNKVLIYCTKVKYLDLGHNWSIRDASFVSYMPELEVLILAINHLEDISPLADCPKLEYLELFMTDFDDLSPLAGLRELRHLNIGINMHITDLSPLYGLELERLYIGSSTGIPREQMEEYARLHPDCEIDMTHEDTSVGAWRFTDAWDNDPDYMAQDYYLVGCAPRYALLREQFGYHGDNSDYSFSWKDPNY